MNTWRSQYLAQERKLGDYLPLSSQDPKPPPTSPSLLDLKLLLQAIAHSECSSSVLRPGFLPEGCPPFHAYFLAEARRSLTWEPSIPSFYSLSSLTCSDGKMTCGRMLQRYKLGILELTARSLILVVRRYRSPHETRQGLLSARLITSVVHLGSRMLKRRSTYWPARSTLPSPPFHPSCP